jgi:hypothetical protein
MSPPLLATCFHAGFLLGLFFDPEDEGDVPPKRPLTYSGLHGDISQKIIILFILIIFSHLLFYLPNDHFAKRLPHRYSVVPMLSSFPHSSYM